MNYLEADLAYIFYFIILKSKAELASPNHVDSRITLIAHMLINRIPGVPLID